MVAIRSKTEATHRRWKEATEEQAKGEELMKHNLATQRDLRPSTCVVTDVNCTWLHTLKMYNAVVTRSNVPFTERVKYVSRVGRTDETATRNTTTAHAPMPLTHAIPHPSTAGVAFRVGTTSSTENAPWPRDACQQHRASPSDPKATQRMICPVTLEL